MLTLMNMIACNRRINVYMHNRGGGETKPLKGEKKASTEEGERERDKENGNLSTTQMLTNSVK